MEVVNATVKFKYVLWKHALIQKRRKWQTALEIGLPVWLFIVCAYVRSTEFPRNQRPTIDTITSIDAFD